MVRRRMTVKRLDPWSVLKFGAVANVVLFAVLMLVAGVIWFIVDRLRLVDQVCGIAADVGFTSCGINAGNLFRALSLLGGMGIIVLTAVLVFLAFLYNLISDLTGGLTIGVIEDGPPARTNAGSARNVPTASTPARAASSSGARDRQAVDHEQAQLSRSQGRQRAEGDQLFNEG